MPHFSEKKQRHALFILLKQRRPRCIVVIGGAATAANRHAPVGHAIAGAVRVDRVAVRDGQRQARVHLVERAVARQLDREEARVRDRQVLGRVGVARVVSG